MMSPILTNRASLCRWLACLSCVLAGLSVGASPLQARESRTRLPNIVIIFADDMGYGDVGCYGAKGHKTPHLDRMAREGRRFTNFYVSQPVCSSSRVALLTGCYPNRVGITGALGPSSQHGIHDHEVTLAEICKSKGYRTAIFGKWHLGHHPQFLPTRHGFDEYYGLPYSNDMWPKHPSAKFPDLPLIDHDKTIALNPDQTQLTTAYTERAVKFIEKCGNEPFFLYVPHNMPHVPLFVSDKFQNKSASGLYGDVIEELDWSVGEILATLKKQGIDEQTLVIFTSDNGPWLLYGTHSGSSGPLREGKATCFEGGVRVPCIVRWPGKIPADSVCREPLMTIDLLPTVARLIGATLPAHRIDGLDISPLLMGDTSVQSPHEALYFYWLQHLHAVRSGRWKLHFPHDYPQPMPAGDKGQPGKYRTLKTGLELYDLEQDPGETRDVSAANPEVVKRLQQLADKAREELGDAAPGAARKIIGKGVREPGRIAPPVPAPTSKSS